MLSMFPLYFTFLVLDSPDSPLSLTLSFIPFSAPITILSRTQVTAVPLWQLALSWTILVAAALLSLWLVGRLLRSGMLRYGQKLSLREMGRLLIKRGGGR
jgi:ABC-2 type transport system permease protein